MSGVFSEDVRPAQKLEVSISTMTLFYEIKLIDVLGEKKVSSRCRFPMQ